MAFMRAQHIAHLLLGGYIDSASLESAITTNKSFNGAWIRLLKSGTSKSLFASATALDIIIGSPTALDQLMVVSGEQIAASDDLTEMISNNSAAIKSVVTNSTYLDLWYATTQNFNRLLARVNASGSKIIRQSFTASGTWTNPGNLVAFAYYCNGHGGAGGNAQNNGGDYYGGSGGSGGESVFGQITDSGSLPVGDVVITIPASIASPTTIGAIASAAAGANGATLGSARSETSGGGTTSGDTIYPMGFAGGPTGHIWIPTTGRKQGGNGGKAALSPGFTSDYTNGGAGIRGNGGGIPGGTVNVDRRAQGGTTESAGGCGGLYDSSGGNNGLADAAGSYGAGGGGGTNSNGTPYNGAAGSKGIAAVWAVIE